MNKKIITSLVFFSVGLIGTALFSIAQSLIKYINFNATTPAKTVSSLPIGIMMIFSIVVTIVGVVWLITELVKKD